MGYIDLRRLRFVRNIHQSKCLSWNWKIAVFYTTYHSNDYSLSMPKLLFKKLSCNQRNTRNINKISYILTLGCNVVFNDLIS